MTDNDYLAIAIAHELRTGERVEQIRECLVCGGLTRWDYACQSSDLGWANNETHDLSDRDCWHTGPSQTFHKSALVLWVRA